MGRRIEIVVLLAAALAANIAQADASGTPTALPATSLGFEAAGELGPETAAPLTPPVMASLLALQAQDPAAEPPRRGRSMTERRRPGAPRIGMDPQRARILLQSLTVPGWGQASLGRRTSATVFAIAEAGVWGSFTAFRIQEQLRRRAYENTARLFAGIDLSERDEEFRRVVGSFPSSEDYNRLVVMRDAANLFYDKPEEYRAYIAEHELKGADAWAWDSEKHYLRYREERKNTQRAALRANAVLALAIANRLVSAIHAARFAGRSPAPNTSGWNFECVPVGNDPTAFHVGVRARF
jgi:hypothetical protein